MMGSVFCRPTGVAAYVNCKHSEEITQELEYILPEFDLYLKHLLVIQVTKVIICSSYTVTFFKCCHH